MLIENTIILSHRLIKGGYRLLTLKSSKIAPMVQPGQFVHLRVPPSADAVLRRPFSVFRAQAGRLAILYKTVGKGTQAMEALRTGDEVNLVGPLGNGYPNVCKNSLPVLVAGGYGMAALYLVAQRTKVKGIVFVGGKCADDILCADDFRRLGWNVRVATEDGSTGQKGLVTRILDAWLNKKPRGRTPEFFACGPNGLLKAICKRVGRNGWDGWISMDRHMGCGLGACLACVQKVRKRDASGKETWAWARVCTEGPVFACRDIVWEDNGMKQTSNTQHRTSNVE
ncbi:MAG: dihydroorotate dehydrogenase electron transfer subunit [Verrucomicrobia bacterium]|nr:dihydroorotate dehydrogenase electron transfer subunit [Verrucomicrobiota bacterium]MBU1856244.1 dihydroorotate dehydrogenase electron transfer subunit [Verrucomicrobiota bacterium]